MEVVFKKERNEETESTSDQQFYLGLHWEGGRDKQRETLLAEYQHPRFFHHIDGVLSTVDVL